MATIMTMLTPTRISSWYRREHLDSVTLACTDAADALTS